MVWTKTAAVQVHVYRTSDQTFRAESVPYLGLNVCHTVVQDDPEFPYSHPLLEVA